MLPLCLLKDLRYFPLKSSVGLAFCALDTPRANRAPSEETENKGASNMNENHKHLFIFLPSPLIFFVSFSKLSYTSGVSVLADLLLTLIVLFAGAQEARWAIQQHPQTIKPCVFLAALCFLRNYEGGHVLLDRSSKP